MTLMRRPPPWRALAAAAPLLLFAGCAAPSPLEREFDPEAAMTLEIANDDLVLDGAIVDPDDFAEAARRAHAEHGRGRRMAALVLVRMEPRDGETEAAFEQRRQRRKNDVLELLESAGVRDIQFGPPGPPPGTRRPAESPAEPSSR